MEWSPDHNALRGRVAVVAGATRGAGRGIAAALGEAGATVVCTGRSSRTGAIRFDYDRAETIWGGELLKGGLSEWNMPRTTNRDTGSRCSTTWPKSQ